jgi:membrane associated rhomboid family serine protease
MITGILACHGRGAGGAGRGAGRRDERGHPYRDLIATIGITFPRGRARGTTEHVTTPSEDPSRFGTQAFYASLGRAFVIMCAVVPVLALIEFADQRLNGAIDAFAGIRPHRLDGLDGILLAPLVHSGWEHLLANSSPLILLGTFALAGGTGRFLSSTLIIMIFSGMGVWLLTAPNYLVVGASGVIFGWLGLLFMRGIVERSLWSFAVALIVGLLYGWQLVLLLPLDEQISWQGHLFGFVGGLAAAIVVPRRRLVGPRTEAVSPISTGDPDPTR